LNTIKIYKRKTLFKEIKDTPNLLDYLNTSSKTKFIKINNSLIEYINKNIPETILKTTFDALIQKYQTATSNRTELFWTRRGYTLDEAKQKISEIQNNSKHINYKKRLVPNQKGYWVKKGLSESEAALKVQNIQKERSPRSIDYYIKKGLSESEAILEVKKYQDKSEYINYESRLLPSNIDYWTNKGFTKLEAKNKVQEHQTTFSKEILEQKYSKDKANKILDEVARKKRETFHSRPQNEQESINTKRGTGSIGYWNNGKFHIDKNLKDTPGTLYYFKCEIDCVKYWKVGITSKTFDQRFNKTFQKRYNVQNIMLEHGTIYECFNKEQNILLKNSSIRVKTKLGTEYFKENINTIKEQINETIPNG